MSVGVAQTVWMPGNGTSEYMLSGNPFLDTETSLDLITETGDSIILEDLLVTDIPQTIWVENDAAA